MTLQCLNMKYCINCGKLMPSQGRKCLDCGYDHNQENSYIYRRGKYQVTFTKNSKVGVKECNSDGDEVIIVPPIYDYIKANKDCFTVYKDGKMSIIDNEEILLPWYDCCIPIQEHFKVFDGHYWKVVDKANADIIPPEYDSIEPVYTDSIYGSILECYICRNDNIYDIYNSEGTYIDSADKYKVIIDQSEFCSEIQGITILKYGKTYRINHRTCTSTFIGDNEFVINEFNYKGDKYRITEIDNAYYLKKGKELITDIAYELIIHPDAVTNNLGSSIDTPIVLVKKNGKWGAFVIEQGLVVDCLYDKIDLILTHDYCLNNRNNYNVYLKLKLGDKYGIAFFFDKFPNKNPNNLDAFACRVNNCKYSSIFKTPCIYDRIEVNDLIAEDLGYIIIGAINTPKYCFLKLINGSKSQILISTESNGLIIPLLSEEYDNISAYADTSAKIAFTVTKGNVKGIISTSCNKFETFVPIQYDDIKKTKNPFEYEIYKGSNMFKYLLWAKI